MIALYQGKSWLSRLIRWWTRTPYSHAAWLCEGGSVIEAWDGGVRMVASLDAQHTPGTVVHVYGVDGCGPEQRAAVERFLTAQLGKGYDYLGFLRFLTRRNVDDRSRWFCSELVLDALAHAGIAPLVRFGSYIVAPGFLAWSPRLRFNFLHITTEAKRQKSTENEAPMTSTAKTAAIAALTGAILWLASGCASTDGRFHTFCTGYAVEKAYRLAGEAGFVRQEVDGGGRWLHTTQLDALGLGPTALMRLQGAPLLDAQMRQLAAFRAAGKTDAQMVKAYNATGKILAQIADGAIFSAIASGIGLAVAAANDDGGGGGGTSTAKPAAEAQGAPGGQHAVGTTVVQIQNSPGAAVGIGEGGATGAAGQAPQQ